MPKDELSSMEQSSIFMSEKRKRTPEACRICGLSNRAEIVNPDKEDVERALYILRRYRKINE